jgi:hypothetical protein
MATAEIRADCAPERDFWETARGIKRGLNDKTTSASLFPAVLAVNSLDPSDHGSLESLVDSWKIDYDLAISNLGNLQLPARFGSRQLQAMHVAVNARENENLLVVTTAVGRMSFTFASTMAALKVSTAKRIKEEAMAQLGKAVGW